jgi:hypothetical protein
VSERVRKRDKAGVFRGFLPCLRYPGKTVAGAAE